MKKLIVRTPTSDRQIIQIEPWIFPTLEGTWASISGRPARFRRSSFDLVEIAGQVTGGVIGTPALTLPVGFRPDYLIEVGAYSWNGAAANFGSLVINTNGQVIPQTGSPDYFQLHVIFRAA